MNSFKRTLGITLVFLLFVSMATVSYADNDYFLGIVAECHDYIRENGFYYSKYVELPLDRPGNKRVDCSSFVSWCVYKYTDGKFDQTRSSYWFNDVADALEGGWTPEMPEITANWKVIRDQELDPGDIMLYSGHIHVYAGTDEKGQRYVYNAGGDEAIQDEVGIISEAYFKESKRALRITNPRG